MEAVQPHPQRPQMASWCAVLDSCDLWVPFPPQMPPPVRTTVVSAVPVMPRPPMASVVRLPPGSVIAPMPPIIHAPRINVVPMPPSAPPIMAPRPPPMIVPTGQCLSCHFQAGVRTLDQILSRAMADGSASSSSSKSIPMESLNLAM